MSESLDKVVTPIRADVKIGPPDPDNIKFVEVDPHLRVVNTEERPIEEPQQPQKRRLLKGLAALFGGLAAYGTASASKTKTGQDILNASPFTQHQTNRPPITEQFKEVNQKSPK